MNIMERRGIAVEVACSSFAQMSGTLASELGTSASCEFDQLASNTSFLRQFLIEQKAAPGKMRYVANPVHTRLKLGDAGVCMWHWITNPSWMWHPIGSSETDVNLAKLKKSFEASISYYSSSAIHLERRT